MSLLAGHDLLAQIGCQRGLLRLGHARRDILREEDLLRLQLRPDLVAGEAAAPEGQTCSERQHSRHDYLKSNNSPTKFPGHCFILLCLVVFVCKPRSEAAAPAISKKQLRTVISLR